MYNNQYLLDYDFLRQLDRERNRIIRVKITTLTWDEFPIESIEGNITSGNISIDGNSSIRRTCSLTMVAQNVDLNNFYQGLNTKFAIEVGIGNSISSKYPDIIWIPQGIFILTSFNSSISVNNYTITLSGKDKMCLLNGEVGGTLGASIDFGVEEEYDFINGTTTYKHILLKDIIYNIVHTHGQEFYEKISINDLDIQGYQLIKYRGDNTSPLFVFTEVNSKEVANVTIQKDFTGLSWYGQQPGQTLMDIPYYEPGVESLLDGISPTVVKVNSVDYTVKKINNEDTIGYRYTDLTYAGELITKSGDSITSVLDKVVKMLGNYEYFYDVYGNFIFQKKKDNLYNNWTPVVSNNGENNLKEIYIDPLQSSLNYTFYGSDMFVSVSHTPDFLNIKNDYSIWGERTTVNGIKIPIHLRYAIHKKPTKYISYNGSIYTSQEYDWRELIYQMAKDYMANGQKDDFVYQIAANNQSECPSGRTGYEMFYTDMFSFWRELYNPDFIQISTTTEEPSGNVTYYSELSKNEYQVIDCVEVRDWPKDRAGNYEKLFNENGYEYIIEAGITPQFDINKSYFLENGTPYNIYKWKSGLSTTQIYYRENDSKDYGFGDSVYGFWNKAIINIPTTLNFWIDFLGENTPLDKYSISAIGDRAKVINDSDVSAIYFKETPNILLKYSGETLATSEGYTIINIPDHLKNTLVSSERKKSAFEVLEQALYENTQSKESLNITAVPIYYLQPNSRIGISNDNSNIHGEFIVSRITLPLTHNGTMQLNVTRAIDTNYSGGSGV